MRTTPKISSLAQSMEQTIETSNLSFIGDIGEVALDCVLEDGIIRDIPILGTIVGGAKCIKNISDALFTKKLIAFLYGIKDTEAEVRKEAISRWEHDAKYRIRIGETLLNMIHRCDDTQKAIWLSQLFYHLVLQRGYNDLFMRAEKALSVLSVMDVYKFLELPSSKYKSLSLEEAEPFFNSGLYRLYADSPIYKEGTLEFNTSCMTISEIGICIYEILNNSSTSWK